MNEKLNYEFEEILQYLKDIENLDIKFLKEFEENRFKNLAASMCIFNILNSIIEIGEVIISENNFETPLKYKEIFEILKKNKVLSISLANDFASFMYQRNMLAHQYGKINKNKIYEVIKKKNLFIVFIEEIKNFVLTK